jgi:hypothetical protein
MRDKLRKFHHFLTHPQKFVYHIKTSFLIRYSLNIFLCLTQFACILNFVNKILEISFFVELENFAKNTRVVVSSEAEREFDKIRFHDDDGKIIFCKYEIA